VSLNIDLCDYESVLRKQKLGAKMKKGKKPGMPSCLTRPAPLLPPRSIEEDTDDEEEVTLPIETNPVEAQAPRKRGRPSGSTKKTAESITQTASKRTAEQLTQTAQSKRTKK
jgi:hypothetical protein